MANSLFAVGESWSQASIWLKKGDVIEVSAPTEAKRVRLEVRDKETGEWDATKTGHLPGSRAGKIYLEIPFDVDRNRVRVRWNSSDPLPYSFYEGRSKFGAREGDASSASAQFRTTELAFSAVADSAEASDDGTDNVQESDVWRLSGDRLYFFNQMRGLQVVDLSQPNDPKVIARHRLPASGEQMYVTEDGDYAYLLARKSGQNWPYSSEVRVLKLDDSEITEVARLDLDASYRESRMVGDKLYVLSEKWEKDKMAWQNWSFSYSTRLATFDLSDPDNPRKIDEKILAGAPQVISATNSNLMVVTRDPSDYYNKHLVRVFDLTGFTGVPEQITEVKPGGRVLDKFKLRIRNGILTVISQAYREESGRNRYSLLETFKISSGKHLGSMELAERETLYATRFDGDYAYVVTFLRTDPLFIIDLTKPKKPRLVSELIVPGWSEYIQPMGDQLFAVGVEEGRVTASLFDVSDKENPRLAYRVFMGKEGAYSWSEANYDEKAIGQLPSQNLFLIPFQSWEEGGYVKKVQILEVTNTGLVTRGEITHRFQARRAAPDETGMRIFSISGNELRVTDFADRENPKPLAQMPLAWKVDRIHHSGDHLLQIEDQGGYYWGWGMSSQDANATLRVTNTATPDELISSLDLGAGTIAGSLVHAGKLHLALANNGKLVAEVYDLESNGSAIRLASAEVKLKSGTYRLELKAFILDEKTVCWATVGKKGQTYFPYEYRRSGIMMDDVMYPYPSYGPATVEAHTFTYEENLAGSTLVHEANASITLSGNVQWSEPFLLQDRILYGSTVTSHLYDSKDNWRVVNSDVNSSLHGFDLTEPKTPKTLAPASLPGLLAGIHQLEEGSQEAYLFSESKDTSIGIYRPRPVILDDDSGEFKIIPETERYGRSLTACAYDGTLAYYLDELDLSGTSGPLAVAKGNVFVGLSNSQSPGVDGYRIDESGLFAKTSGLFKGENLSELATDGSYLIGRTNNGVRVADLHQVDSPYEWPNPTLSGNLYPTIGHFVSSADGIRIPVGNYGVEYLAAPPSTERRTLQARRSGTVESWTTLDESLFRVFKADEVPVSLAHASSPGWKFRQDSALDQNATSLEAHWKSLPWFGFFHARSYPWIYHARLGWTYVSEGEENALWLWRAKSGWLWTRPDLYPHLYHHATTTWSYLDLKAPSNTVRLYDHSAKDWRTE